MWKAAVGAGRGSGLMLRTHSHEQGCDAIGSLPGHNLKLTTTQIRIDGLFQAWRKNFTAELKDAHIQLRMGLMLLAY